MEDKKCTICGATLPRRNKILCGSRECFLEWRRLKYQRTVVHKGRAKHHDVKPEYRQISRERFKNLQPSATEAALKSPKSGPFESNYRAKTWRIIDPNGESHTFRNLNLFAKKVCPDNWYNFSCGIQRLQATAEGRRTGKKVCYTYKGWTLSD